MNKSSVPVSHAQQYNVRFFLLYSCISFIDPFVLCLMPRDSHLAPTQTQRLTTKGLFQAAIYSPSDFHDTTAITLLRDIAISLYSCVWYKTFWATKENTENTVQDKQMELVGKQKEKRENVKNWRRHFRGYCSGS